MDIPERILELRGLINKWNEEYHDDDAPTIADTDFDRHYRELVSLELQRPDLVTPDSPTQRAGYAPKERGFKKVRHIVPMLSLGNVFDFDNLMAWYKLTGLTETEGDRHTDPKATGEVKLDGLAVGLRYIDGVFAQGVTRGDGEVGEDVTDNLMQVEGIPLELKGDDFPSVLEVRGEVTMHKAQFLALNERLAAQGQEPKANPRNAAAGTLRQSDSGVVKDRGLTFYLYSVIQEIKPTHEKQLQKAAEWGFNVNPTFPIDNAKDFAWFMELMETARPNLAYEIDGLVFKVNELALQRKLGFRSREPRWAVALKFQAQEATAVLQNVVNQVGRTGQVTPVAKILPVRLAGVTVSSVTLHNYDEVTRLGLGLLDEIRVCRAGDVIPKILRVVMKNTPHAQVEPPTHCPVCNSVLVKVGADLMCQNGWECSAQTQRRFEHFVSRGALNIDGIGPSTLDCLIEAGKIQRPQDLFKLVATDFLELPGFAATSARDCHVAIHTARKQNLHNFLFGLGIPEVGEGTSKRLSRRFATASEIAHASYDDFKSIKDIGDETATSLVSWFKEPRNQETYTALLEILEISNPLFNASNQDLAGQNWAITGSFDHYSRDQLKDVLSGFGANVSSDVTKKTDVLLAGVGGGGKLDKAKKLDVRVMAPVDFDRFVDDIKAGLNPKVEDYPNASPDA